MENIATPPGLSCRIARADALDALGGIRGIDACIADPPYMISSKSYGQGKMDPWSDYMNAALWYRTMLETVRSTLNPWGCAWVFGNWRGLATMTKAASDAGWEIAACMTWKKGSWIGPGHYLRHCSELILLFAMPGFRIENRSIAEIQEFKPVPANKRLHQAQKPVELLRFLIENSTPEGGTVLDPFMGSGSTGVACAETGRSFVGVEMTEHYYAVARARIAEAYARG